VKLLRDDLHVLTGSYALDAISDEEREEFERHLHHCPACDAEVRGLRETAARLAMARAVRPPARMEQRVLAAAYRTRQLPPLPSDRLRAARDRRRAQVKRLFARRPAPNSVSSADDLNFCVEVPGSREDPVDPGTPDLPQSPDLP